MYVSRRIERDNVSEIHSVAGVLDRLLHLECGVVVGHEEEWCSRCLYSVFRMEERYISPVEWGYLQLDQFASWSGDVQRDVFIVLCEV